MTQEIDNKLWNEFSKELSKTKKKLEGRAKIQNSTLPTTEWTRKIVEVIKISELASENGISECPFCEYNIYFDDTKGWFICGRQRWSKKKCFSGNIVDFQHWLDTGEI